MWEQMISSVVLLLHVNYAITAGCYPTEYYTLKFTFVYFSLHHNIIYYVIERCYADIFLRPSCKVSWLNSSP